MAARLTHRRRGPVTAFLGLGGLALVLVGCAPSGSTVASGPPTFATPGPQQTTGGAVVQTRADLVRALGERNLVLQDSQAPFRPPEDARFTATPRALYQVILPKAPEEGFIVVYDFPDPIAAAEAARDQAAYLATGPARVQSAFGARHILRLVGSTVVLYSWVPQGAVDPRQPDIQAALETVGSGVPIPS
jgi:hypothetical protein